MHRAWLLALVVVVACSGDDADPGLAGSGAGAGGTGGDAAVSGTGGDPDAGTAAGTGGTSGSDAGAGTGGTSGSDAGAGTGGSAGMPSELNECEIDADCKVDGDCCSCVAVPSSTEVPPTCDATCAENQCARLGVSAVCALGRCILDASCNDREVTCKSLPPECPPGQKPLVDGNCWGGGCVDVRDCFGVKSCDACSDDQACVSPDIFGPGSNVRGLLCWDVEPACDGKPTCECMGSEICPLQCGDNTDRPDDPIDISCFCVLC